MDTLVGPPRAEAGGTDALSVIFYRVIFLLKKANPSKGGDAKLRDYRP
jgi:hypothetical protein